MFASVCHAFTILISIIGIKPVNYFDPRERKRVVLNACFVLFCFYYGGIDAAFNLQSIFRDMHSVVTCVSFLIVVVVVVVWRSHTPFKMCVHVSFK